MVFSQMFMESEDTMIVDFELKEDLTESYESNGDISFLDLNLKGKIEAMSVGTLLEVKKKIGSPIVILSAKEVDDGMVSSFFK